MAVIDRCVRLHEEGEHTEALAVALRALHPFGPRPGRPADRGSDPQLPSGRGSDPSPADPALAVAVLWTLVAMARRALAEARSAREPLAAALAWAPDRAWDGEPGPEAARLGLLAALLARRLVTEAAQSPEVSEETLGDLGVARALTRAAALALPGDRGVADMAERAQEALWGATEEGVRGLLSRREFAAAHRLVDGMIESGEAPPERAAALRDLLRAAAAGGDSRPDPEAERPAETQEALAPAVAEGARQGEAATLPPAPGSRLDAALAEGARQGEAALR
jgi:hypothetical protein